jgi:hypothetical protein
VSSKSYVMVRPLGSHPCVNEHCRTGYHMTWEARVRCAARHGEDLGRWDRAAVAANESPELDAARARLQGGDEPPAGVREPRRPSPDAPAGDDAMQVSIGDYPLDVGT